VEMADLVKNPVSFVWVRPGEIEVKRAIGLCCFLEKGRFAFLSSN